MPKKIYIQIDLSFDIRSAKTKHGSTEYPFIATSICCPCRTGCSNLNASS